MGMKGMVFTLDSIIALLLMASIISLLLFYRVETSSPFFTSQQLHSLSEDSLNVLSQSTVREVVNKTLLNSLKQNGTLNESYWDEKVIDVLGMLWAENDTAASSAAYDISKDVLGDMLPENIGYQVLINDDNIYNSFGTSRPSESEAEVGIAAGRIASGYESNKSVSGCVALAYLTSIKGKRDSSYVYFGGYVGDGNITTNITLPPFDKILEAYMEMDAGSNFTLYINDNLYGTYVNGSAGGGLMRADKWVVCKDTTYNPSYESDVIVNSTPCSNFIEGNNTLKFNFTRNNSFIGGGYFRVTYNTTQLAPQEEVGKSTYWFPGISGFFNLYDSFYAPGTLTNMTSYLHYFNNITNATVYLSIGNVKVFSNNSTGEQKISLNYSDMWQKFVSQQNLINNVSNKTVPLRFGVEGFVLKPGVGAADAVLVTDVSGSMDTCDVNSSLFSDCSGTPGMQNRRIDVAKNVSKVFVDTVLSTSGDRIGLVAYSAEPGIRWWYRLSNDSASLKNQIDSYTSNGFTCTSCGIDNATKTLVAQSSPSRFRGILVMSDGLANTIIPGTNGGGGGSTPQCPDTEGFRSNAGREATQKACEAKNATNLINATFGIAFGSEADQDQMKRIACWNCTACPNVCLTDDDCNQLYTQSTCQASQCSWNPATSNVTIFNDGFEVDITTNWSATNRWNRVNDYAHGGSSYSAKIAGSSTPRSGNLTTDRSMNTTGVNWIYVDLWFRDDDCDATDVWIQYNDSNGNWDNIRDIASDINYPTEDTWTEWTQNITDSQYFHSGFAVRIEAQNIGSGENFWIDDVKINKNVNGFCENISSSCWVGNVTLPNGTQADCRAVRYAQSNNVDELKNIYGTFGQMFAILGYITQKANITGNVNLTNILYPDSHIDLQYSPSIIPYEYGEISLNIEAPRLKNLTGDNISKPYKEGWFNVSDKVKVVDAKITSYSSDYWTDMLNISSSVTGGWKEVYNLTNYGSDYTALGDPFIIYMPTNNISSGNNSVRIETAFSTINKTGGSPDDRVIYTVRVKGSVDYGSLKGTCQDAENDAYKRLNDSIGGYVSFTTNEIAFENNSISRVPYMWGPAIVKIKVWS